MKYLVFYKRTDSTIDKNIQLFNENEMADMKAFIDRKVLSGMTCHIYEHRDTFKLNKTVETVSNQ